MDFHRLKYVLWRILRNVSLDGNFRESTTLHLPVERDEMGRSVHLPIASRPSVTAVGILKPIYCARKCHSQTPSRPPISSLSLLSVSKDQAFKFPSSEEDEKVGMRGSRLIARCDSILPLLRWLRWGNPDEPQY
jgi:hypothetical protein